MMNSQYYNQYHNQYHAQYDTHSPEMFYSAQPNYDRDRTTGSHHYFYSILKAKLF